MLGSSAQASCRNRESVPVVPPAAQADILDGDFDSPEPRPSLVHARPSELQQKLGEIKSRLGGMGTLPRVPGQCARPHADPLLPRHQSPGLSDLLPRVGNKVDCGSQSAIRGSSADLLPDLTEPQSVGKVSGGGDEGVESFMRALVRALRGDVSKEQVGVDDDEFFDSEGFHEASPEFKPFGAIAPVTGPLAGGSSLMHEELSWVPGRGGNFRPTTSLGLPGDCSISATARMQWVYGRVER